MSEVNLSEMMELDNEQDLPSEVILKTGVTVGDVPSLTKKDQSTRPNAVRWTFNPGVAVVDLTNESASYSVPFLGPIAFNKIQSIPTRVQAHKPFDMNLVPGPGGEDAEYDRIDRTSYQQAKDLEDKHSEKGVQILSQLFDAPDEDAAALNSLLFGSTIPCRPDPNNDRFPVPVLPNLLELLHKNATAAIRNARADGAAADAELIKSTAEELRDAIGRGIKWARAMIRDAQERFLDEKNPNRKFSALEERCYLALGEEIPDQLPLTTKARAAAGHGNVSIDSEALGRGVAAGLASAGVTIGQTQAPAETPAADIPAVGSKAEEVLKNIDFSVSEEDLANAEKVSDPLSN